MLKYVNTKVTFAEIPEEITLCIEISGCKIHCKGCHSQHLWKDIGEELTPEVFKKLVSKNSGITCVCIMGGEIKDVLYLLETVRPWKMLGWYTGHTEDELKENSVDYERLLTVLDYLKVGPYDEKCGPLTEPTTNQRFYLVGGDKTLYDRTEMFYSRKIEM